VPKKATRQPKPLYRQKPSKKTDGDFVHAEIIPSSHFELREDGTIAVEKRDAKHAPTLAFHDDARGLWLYHGNCLELLDAIAAKYPEGRFDAIFADPPYFFPTAVSVATPEKWSRWTKAIGTNRAAQN